MNLILFNALPKFCLLPPRSSVEAASSGDGEPRYVIIEFFGDRTAPVVVCTDDVESITQQILEENGIRSRMSDDVRALVSDEQAQSK